MFEAGPKCRVAVSAVMAHIYQLSKQARDRTRVKRGRCSRLGIDGIRRGVEVSDGIGRYEPAET